MPQTTYLAQADDPAWIKMIYSSDANPIEVREAYESFYKENEFVKNRHTQFYKRWMRQVWPLTSLNGDIINPSELRWQDDYLEDYQAVQTTRMAGEWEEMGPWHWDPEVALDFFVQSPGACHIYTVEQSASNPDVVWAGTATAGAWKSTDKGLHWDLMTREMLITGTYSISIDPNDEDTVLIEGSGGIYKSTDGGVTWNITGDNDFQDTNLWTRDLRHFPGESDRMLAATNGGLFYSDDSGSNWTEVGAGEFMEIEFHPNTNNTIYAVKLINDNTLFQKSVDGGLSWSSGAIGWPTPVLGDHQKRCEIAVSADAPDNVYVLASGSANGGSGLYGIYKSTDEGVNFEFMCCGEQPAGPPVAGTNPNTLGWSEQGEGDGGQFYYDLGLDVSPTDSDLMFSSGINVWRSENGGTDWTMNAHWVTWVEGTIGKYTHADVHDVKFFQTDNGVDMWIASDGGLFYSSDQGDNIESRQYGIHGTDFWGWQAGFKHGDVMVGGTYHNGTMIRNGDIYPFGLNDEESGGWLAELAGDNFRGFVNPGDATVGYHDGGAFKYSPDRWTRISGLSFDNSKLPNTSYYWGEYGNMEFDPACYNYIYSPVGSELWKSENGGSSFELLHDFGGDKVVTVKVAPRDRDRIYVTHRISGTWHISRSDDGGDTWTQITPENAVVGNNNGNAKYIDVDGLDPDKLWVIILGWQNGNKIFQSNDAGQSWTDISGSSMDNQYVTQLAHQRGTSDGIYIGTQQAVYYKNSSMNDWEMYNLDLPASTASVFMQNNYCDEKVRIAGPRGVHQADFFETSGVIAGLTASKLNINLGVQCEADTIRFTDNSIVACDGAEFIWNFEGGVANSITDETVYVVYGSPGTFNVSLTVIDAIGGTDTVIWEDLIEVIDEPVSIPLVEDFNNGFPPEHWKIEDPEGGGTWEHGTVLGDPTNRVAQFPNYWVDTSGQTDLLVMPAIDVSSLEQPILHFDVSYTLYADYIDGLSVLYKTNPNDDWGVLYEKTGAELAVNDNYVWFWYDEGGELLWRTDTVNLAPIADAECITLAFSNIGGYGNHIWIDNVNLTAEGVVSIEDQDLDRYLNVFPNPASDQLSFRFPHALGSGTIKLYDSRGRVAIETRVSSSGTIDVSGLSKGMYTWMILFDDGVASKTIVIE